jgi:hypothetical protein
VSYPAGLQRQRKYIGPLMRSRRFFSRDGHGVPTGYKQSPEHMASRKWDQRGIVKWIRHGDSRAAGSTSEYASWERIIQRSTNPRMHNWKYYGGRGITVCDRWRNSFENFLADMGRKPSPRLSIDRINNDGNYEPGNCRWATQKEQIANRRRTICPKV